jgi:hypothetical protein
LWDHTNPLNHDIVKQYTEHLKYAIEQWDMDFFDPDSNQQVRPNLMQRQALKEISRYRSLGSIKPWWLRQPDQAKPIWPLSMPSTSKPRNFFSSFTKT